MQGKLRIIGGKWRGKKFDVPPVPEVRPTPNRVRETLFNWLAPVIRDARCLDLFAGSGALGLEALSRGAQAVVFIDHSPIVIRHLQNLRLAHARIKQSNGLTYLAKPSAQPFDIIFLDPPFHQNLIETCSTLLQKNGFLHPGSYIYLEMEAGLNPSLPEGWHVFRSKVAGQVGYHLVVYNTNFR